MRPGNNNNLLRKWNMRNRSRTLTVQTFVEVFVSVRTESFADEVFDPVPGVIAYGGQKAGRATRVWPSLATRLTFPRTRHRHADFRPTRTFFRRPPPASGPRRPRFARSCATVSQIRIQECDRVADDDGVEPVAQQERRITRTPHNRNAALQERRTTRIPPPARSPPTPPTRRNVSDKFRTLYVVLDGTLVATIKQFVFFLFFCYS